MKYILFFLICALIIFSLSAPAKTCLILSNQQTAEKYFLKTMKDKEEFTLSWRHSVELQPWEERFRVNLPRNEFVLVETRFRSYGAGVPDLSPGSYELRDGFIIYKDLQRSYAFLPFYHSHYALYHLKFGNSKYDLSLFIPDNTKVVLSLEKLPPRIYLWSALKFYLKNIRA